MANDWASKGILEISKGGEMLSPSQEYFLGIIFPCAKAGLVKLNDPCSLGLSVDLAAPLAEIPKLRKKKNPSARGPSPFKTEEKYFRTNMLFMPGS